MKAGAAVSLALPAGPVPGQNASRHPLPWKAGSARARLQRSATRPWSIFMNSTLSLPELEDRIAILRDNIRQLVEQAAGAGGSENEERGAERIGTHSDGR